MKTTHAISLILLGFSALEADDRYPKSIESIEFCEAFFDGGSTVLEFEDEAGYSWKLFFDNRLDASDEEKGSISLSPLSDFPDQVAPLLIQSDENQQMLEQMIRHYLKSDAEVEPNHRKILESMISKRDLLPGKPQRTEAPNK